MIDLTHHRGIELTLVDICAILDDNRADGLRIQHAMRSLMHVHTFLSALTGSIDKRYLNPYEKLLGDIFFVFQNLLIQYEVIVHEMDTPLPIYTGD